MYLRGQLECTTESSKLFIVWGKKQTHNYVDLCEQFDKQKIDHVCVQIEKVLFCE